MASSGLQAEPMDQALRVKDVALLLQVDEKTVYRLTQRASYLDSRSRARGASSGRISDAWVERQKTAVMTSAKGLKTAKTKERH